MSLATAHPYHGLADIVVGSSAICTVGKEGLGLSYRGYAIEELAAQASFEEVAYLLLHGELPTRPQLHDFIDALIGLRAIPTTLKILLETIPAQAHPMDVLRSACSLLGSLEPEQDFSQQLQVSYRLLAILPAVLIYWYRY
ncbi:MAG: citrate/2-methylcitrate synthase, partial [Thiohalomonadales bacterium]